MHPRIREIIDTVPHSKSTLEEVVTLLPEEDAELDSWIGEVVASSDVMGTLHLIGAALHAGKTVSSRHIGEGTKLLNHALWAGLLVTQAKGDDIAEQVARTVRIGGLMSSTQTLIILLTWIWCEEKGVEFPGSLMKQARKLAHLKIPDPETTAYLLHFSSLSREDGIRRACIPCAGKPEEEEKILKHAKTVAETRIAHCKEPFGKFVRTEPIKGTRGKTMRRSVAETKRNAPCPCGSGKKYKRCCSEKDKERLQYSTDVAGKTSLELLSDYSGTITADLLKRASTPELMKIDVTKVPAELHEPLVLKFCKFSLLDKAVDLFESIPWNDALTAVWEKTVEDATLTERENLLRRLLAARGMDDTGENEELRLDTRILLARENPELLLGLIDAASRELHTCEKQEQLNYALSCFYSPTLGPLAIVFMRAIIPLLSRKAIASGLEMMSLKRAELGLPPEDPIAGIMEKLFTEAAGHDDHKYDDKLRTAKRNFDVKASQVKTLNAKLTDLQEERTELEKKLETAAEKTGAANHPPDPELQERLKHVNGKLDSTQENLREANAERAEFRSALAKQLDENEALREANAKLQLEVEKTRGTPDEEDSLTLPWDGDAIQPVRLVTFPEKFHKWLGGFPSPVSRGAMETLGRLAAGDDSTFRGVVRLKQVAGLYRIRIGADHRLLFRITPEAVEVVNLINRRDLDQTLKPLR